MLHLYEVSDFCLDDLVKKTSNIRLHDIRAGILVERDRWYLGQRMISKGSTDQNVRETLLF